jgi:hypothetical protein
LPLRINRARTAAAAELVTLYPNRGAVPGALWRSVLDGAEDCIDVLVFSGLFSQTAIRK